MASNTVPPSPDDFEEVRGEIVPQLSRIDRAEIDMQIATAHKFPRSIERFQRKAMSMLTLNQETALECFYVLKRRERGGGEKRIEGPSVRLAEIVACSWGNMRAGGRVCDEDDHFIYGQGVCHDLESNLAVSIEVGRRITNRDGGKYGDDMVGVTGNAAVSIAYRNAVLRVVPKALWFPLYKKALEIARGDEKTLEARRKALVESFETLGVKLKAICEYLGVGGLSDIGLDQLVDLRGVYSAIQAHETTVEECFGGSGPGTGGVRRAAPAPQPTEPAATTSQEPATTSKKAAKPVKPAPEAKIEPEPEYPTPEEVSKAQRRLMGAGWSLVDVKTYLKQHCGTEQIGKLPRAKLEAILVAMESGSAPSW